MLKDILLNYLKNAELKYSIYIKDLKTGETCLVNHLQIVPSASIIKLFIMGATLEMVKAGKLSLKGRIILTKEEKVSYSILTLLDDKNSYTINDLILLMIIQSDNTATNKLISILGFDCINKFIKDNNFESTILQRKMMDHKGKENLCNLKDVTLFLDLIYNRKLIDEKYSKLMVSILTEQLDHSMMRLNLPENTIIANKTGDLELINHDVGIVFTEKKDYIFAMLTWDTVNDYYAKSIISCISKITYDYFMNGGD